MVTGPLHLLVWIWIKGQIQASLSFSITLQVKVLLHILSDVKEEKYFITMYAYVGGGYL